MAALERRLLRKLQARQNPNSYNFHNGMGVPAGLPSRWTQLGYNFTQMTAQEIANTYKTELDRGDPDRIFLCNEWIFKRVFTA